MLYINASILEGATEKIQTESFIEVHGETITGIGKMSALSAKPHDVIDAEGKLIMPGLINGHSHGAMVLYRGLADDLELGDWLHNHIFPAEKATVNKEMIYWCTKLAIAEMLLSGTTCVADGYFFSAEAAKAFKDCGMRAVIAHGIIDFPTPSVPDPKKKTDALTSHINNLQGDHSLITPAVFAHSPYTCSPETLVAAKKIADEMGCRFLIHIAESPKEQQNIIDAKGATPIQHLAALGILDENCACIHAVWLNDEDLQIMRKSGAHAILCPQSNMKLASGVSKAGELLSLGVNVGIGTDGAASNNNLDLFREMRNLALLQKVQTKDPSILPARTALQCATTNTANALGHTEIGFLKKGMKADFITLDTNKPNLSPFFNQDTLVYSDPTSAIEDVVINGERVVCNGKIISFNLSETMSKVKEISKKIIQ